MSQALLRDLADVRRRGLELVENGAADLVGATERELEQARGEVADLREILTAAEDDRRVLLERFNEQRRKLQDADAEVEAVSPSSSVQSVAARRS